MGSARRFSFSMLYVHWLMSILLAALWMVSFDLYLTKHMELHVAVEGSNVSSTVAELFLRSYETKVSRQPHHELNEALANMEREETFGVTTFGRNFSQGPHYQLSLSTVHDDIASNGSILDIQISTISQEMRFILQRKIFDSVQKLKAKNATYLSLKVSDPVFGSRLISPLEFLVPRLFLQLISLATVSQTAYDTTTIYYRRIKSMQLAFAGLQPAEIVISHSIWLLCHLLTQTAPVFACMILMCWNNLLPLEGSLTLVMLLIFAQGLQGIIVGLMISCASILLGGKCIIRQTSVFNCLMRCSFIFLCVMASLGVLYPLTCPPPLFWKLKRYLLPITATEALRYIMYRGYSLENVEVLIGFAEMAKRSGLCLILVVVGFKIGRLRI